jgi:predicted nucleic acid-binding protein
MKIVFDSNVIIAAFAAKGLCHTLFEYCVEKHDVIVCEEILKVFPKHTDSQSKILLGNNE